MAKSIFSCSAKLANIRKGLDWSEKGSKWDRDIRKVAYSRTAGFFIGIWHVFTVIQWTVTHISANHNGNIPYPAWKCLPYGSQQPPYYLLILQRVLMKKSCVCDVIYNCLLAKDIPVLKHCDHLRVLTYEMFILKGRPTSLPCTKVAPALTGILKR